MNETRTMLATIKRWAQEQPDAPALHDLRHDGEWQITTWSGYWDALRAVGKGLMALGHEPSEAVALVGENRPEWVICQHGINAAGGVPAPIYTTLLPDQVAYILNNCRAKVAICDKREQLTKLLKVRDSGETSLEHIIAMDDVAGEQKGVYRLSELMERGQSVSEADLTERIDRIGFDDLALLIYTSGTTGEPKGAMITHRGVHAVSHAVRTRYVTLFNADFRYISYLPLCHVAEQVLTNFGGIETGGRLYFCRDIKEIRDYLTKVRPTVFLAVPRVWEKFEAALRGRMAEAKGPLGRVRSALAQWAMKTELAAFRQDTKNGRRTETFARKLAHRLVISKVHAGLGLDALIFAVTGAAPISTSTLEFFASLGIVIHEVYGMTETTGVVTTNPFNQARFGTVGKPLPGVEIKIAEDRELLLRGDSMTKGYLNLPERSAELYSEDGWMHTGDEASIDDEGYIRITGRKKDILITAGGKNIAPSEMEGYIQGIPGVGQAVVVGDRMPFLSALVVLDAEALPELSAASGVASLASVAEAAVHPEVRAFLESRIESDCNRRVARYQTIKKFAVLAEPFAVETGELTPTLKVKRSVVNEKFRGVIDDFYRGVEGAQTSLQQ